MSREQLLKEFQKLSEQEKHELLRELQNSLQQLPLKKTRSLLELAGLGKEIWKGVEVEEYIQNERNWDRDSIRK
jgi:hypothetical protein